MKIFVHVKAKTFTVECGEGTQPIIWLGNVGVARYSNFNTLTIGAPTGVRQESGAFYENNEIIRNCLRDGQHVWVALKERYD
mmetsp:Transcript_33426/g.55955  ORF Transcript_33426/g.55955 Transcript_33426/m.55955 type:complete len:82 (+) Transcript_33426:46-291(+)